VQRRCQARVAASSLQRPECAASGARSRAALPARIDANIAARLCAAAAHRRGAPALTAAARGARRVHTVAFPVVQEVNELFRATDAAATAALLAKLAVEKSYTSKLDETRAAIQVCRVKVG